MIYLSLLLFAAVRGAAAECPTMTTSIAEVLSDSAHDGKLYCVEGIAQSLALSKPEDGKNHFTTAIQDAAGSRLEVFSFGQPAFSVNGSVRACGVFEIQKRIGDKVFRNQIRAPRECNSTTLRADVPLIKVHELIEHLGELDNKEVCAVGRAYRLQFVAADHIEFDLADANDASLSIRAYARVDDDNGRTIGGKAISEAGPVTACGKYQKVKKTHKKDFSEFTISEVLSR